MPHWKYKNKTKPPRELLCEGPHTKHPVRYFPGQNEMNREKKWDPSQGWMHASLLISRASFHFPVPPAPPRRHKSILYLFSAVSLPNPSDESTWGNSEWGWSTWLQWIGMAAVLALPGLGWGDSLIQLEPQDPEWGTWIWTSQPGQTCWNCSVAKSVAADFVKGNI